MYTLRDTHHHAQVCVHGHARHWMLGWPKSWQDWLGEGN